MPPKRKSTEAELAEKVVQFDNLQVAHAKTQERLKEAEGERDALRRETRQLREQLQGMEGQLARAEKELQAKQQERLQATHELQAAKKRKEELLVEQQRTAEKLDALDDSEHAQKKKIAELTTELQESRTRASTLDRLVSEAKGEALRLRSELQQCKELLESKANALGEQEHSVQQRLDKERKEAASRLDAAAAKWKAAQHDLEEQRAALQTALQAKQSQVEALQVDLEKNKTRYNWTQQDFANVKADWEAKSAAARKSIDQLETEVAELRGQLTTAEQTTASLRESLTKETERAAQLSGVAEDAKKALHSQVERGTALELERDQLRLAAEAAAVTAAEEHRGLVFAKSELAQQLQLAKDDLTRKGEELSTTREALQYQITQLEQQCKRLQEELAEEQRHAARTTAELTEQRDAFEARLTSHSRQAEQERDRLYGQASQGQTDVQHLEAECVELRATLKALQRELEMVKEEKFRMNFAAAKAEEDVRSEARKMKRELSQQVAALVAEKLALEAKMASAREASEKEAEKATQLLDDLRTEGAAQQRAFAELQQDYDLLNDQHSELRLALEKAQRDHEAATDRLAAQAAKAERQQQQRIRQLEQEQERAQEQLTRREQELFCASAELRTADIDRQALQEQARTPHRPVQAPGSASKSRLTPGALKRRRSSMGILTTPLKQSRREQSSTPHTDDSCCHR